MAQRPIPNTNSCRSYLHCANCMPLRPESVSPAEWARLSVGFTEIGLQVWCERCDVNVLHVDYEGQRHPANLTMKVKKSALN